jgi:hypothetical protein
LIFLIHNAQSYLCLCGLFTMGDTIESLREKLSTLTKAQEHRAREISKNNDILAEHLQSIVHSKQQIQTSELEIEKLTNELIEAMRKYSTSDVDRQIKKLRPQVKKLSQKIRSLTWSIKELEQLEAKKQLCDPSYRHVQLVDYRQQQKATIKKHAKLNTNLTRLEELLPKCQDMISSINIQTQTEIARHKSIIRTETTSIANRQNKVRQIENQLKGLSRAFQKVKKSIAGIQYKITHMEAYYEYVQRCRQFIIDQLVEKQSYPDDLSPNHHVNWIEHLTDVERSALEAHEDSDDSDDDSDEDSDEDSGDSGDSDEDDGDDEPVSEITRTDISEAIAEYTSKQLVRLAHRIHFNNLWNSHRKVSTVRNWNGDIYSLWHEDLVDYEDGSDDDTNEAIFILSGNYDGDYDPDDHPNFGRNDCTNYGTITRYHYAIHVRTLLAMDNPPKDLSKPDRDEFHLDTSGLIDSFIQCLSYWNYT